MSYLPDTCLLSELRKPDPDANVVTWVNSIDEARLFISAVADISGRPHVYFRCIFNLYLANRRK